MRIFGSTRDFPEFKIQSVLRHVTDSSTREQQQAWYCVFAARGRGAASPVPAEL